MTVGTRTVLWRQARGHTATWRLFGGHRTWAHSARWAPPIAPNICHPPTPCPWVRLCGEVCEGVVTQSPWAGTAHDSCWGVMCGCAWHVVQVGVMTRLMGCQCQGLGFGETQHHDMLKGGVKSFPTSPVPSKSTKYWLVRSGVLCYMWHG